MLICTPTPRRRQSGISLLESLVALVVLALGVLGLLNAQLRVMVNNQGSNYMASASLLADNLFERVRANPYADPALNPNFNAADPLNSTQWAWLRNYAIGWGGTTQVEVDCETVSCPSPARANWDVNRWKSAVNHTLPQGEAQILVSPDNPRQLIVIIGWRANEQGASPVTLHLPGIQTPAQCGTTHACYSAYGQP